MVKDDSDSERGNPLPPYGLLFPISSKGSFIGIIPQTGYHIPQCLLQMPIIKCVSNNVSVVAALKYTKLYELSKMPQK